MANATLQGIIPPLCTPFRDELVAHDELAENVQRYCGTGISALLALGSNGEARCLSEAERLEVLRTVIGARSGSVAILAGCSEDSTLNALRAVDRAAKLGAEYACVSLPFYYRKYLNEGAQVSFIEEIAEKGSIPIVLYNAPGYTGVNLSASVIQATRGHPRIQAIKDSTLENMWRYPEMVSASFSVLIGTASGLFAALRLGASGGVISLANSVPEVLCRLYNAYVSGELDKARSMQAYVTEANERISGRHGVAGAKYAMDLTGYHGGPPRHPLQAVDMQGRVEIENALKRLIEGVDRIAEAGGAEGSTKKDRP